MIAFLKNHRWHLLLSSATGVMLALSFIPWKFTAFAWIGLIPLNILILPSLAKDRCAHPFLWGFWAGLIFWLSTIHWLRHVSIPAMLALSIFLACYMGAWTGCLSRIRNLWPNPTGSSHCLTSLFGAAAWVSMEWLRGWILGGFPWNNLGVSQYQNLALIQISAWTGNYGVSFLMAYFNLALGLSIRRLALENYSLKTWRYEFSTAIALVFACLLIGFKVVWKSRSTEGQKLSLALIQPNIPQEVKYEPVSREIQESRLKSLSLSLQSLKPDLILWPETALVAGPSFDARSKQWLQELVKELQTPILFGTLDGTSQTVPTPQGPRIKTQYYNAAAMIQSDGTIGPIYRKLHLVPFGEYVPFEKQLPWMKWLTPIEGSFESGTERVLFDLQGLKLGVLICFEDTLPDLARKLAFEGTDLLVNLTNDAWFKDSHESEMHAANALFRCVETRRPMVRCTNHGLTSIILPSGKIAFQGEIFQQAGFIQSLNCQAKAPMTFYTRHGDLFAYACMLLTLVPVIAGCRSPSRSTPHES